MPKTMRVMRLERPRPAGERPLQLVEMPVPRPGPGEVLLAVHACGVCHTDLHTVEGEWCRIARRWYPAIRPSATSSPSARAPTPCRPAASLTARRCARANEWACPGSGAPAARAATAGVATRTSARTRSSPATTWTAATPSTRWRRPPSPIACRHARPRRGAAAVRRHHRLPLPAAHGRGGWRHWVAGRRCGGGAAEPRRRSLGLYGFGAAAHICLQVAVHHGWEVYVFTRGEEHRELPASSAPCGPARPAKCRAAADRWRGGSGASDAAASGRAAADAAAPPLDAAIVFAPAGRARPRRSARLRQGRGGGLGRDCPLRLSRPSTTRSSTTSACCAASPTARARTPANCFASDGIFPSGPRSKPSTSSRPTRRFWRSRKAASAALRYCASARRAGRRRKASVASEPRRGAQRITSRPVTFTTRWLPARLVAEIVQP